MRAFRLPLLYLGVIAVPLAFLLGVQFLTDDELPGVTASSQPLISRATEREVRGEQRVNLELEWTEGRELLSPAWDGTVTTLYVGPGDVLSSGSIIAAVDDVIRFAYATPRPFHRQLQEGDYGEDVAALNAMLVAMQYMEELPWDPEYYGATTWWGVYDLEEALGIQLPTGMFDPGLVAWLPESPFPLATLDLTVSAAAPGAGQVFAIEPARLEGAKLTASTPTEPLTFEPGVEYILAVEGLQVPFDPATVQVTDEGLVMLEGVTTPPEPGSTGGQQPGGLPGQGGGGETLSGLIQRAVPLHSRAVPATSVMVNAGGALCVWVPAPSGYEAVAVRVAGSRAGVTDVVEGLEAGAEVLANPADVLTEPACPSN